MTTDVHGNPAVVLDAEASARARTRAGVLFGVGAYGLWGVFPLYFKALHQVAPLEILAHRIIWSLVLLLPLLLRRRDWRTAVQALRSRRTLVTLVATTLLIAANWLMYIWAIVNSHVVEASLGYFINPLVNVLLGFAFLGERLRRWQVLAVLLAFAGVAYRTYGTGHLPVLALLLATTFGSYGLLRKIAQVDALLGLTVETAVLAPLALAFLGYQMYHGQAAFGSGSASTHLLLLAAGVVTATPLLWFTKAARRLRLTTLGFLQYLSPTGQFLLGVLAFGEPLTPGALVSFACIWAGLVVYSLDTTLRARAPLSAEPEPVVE
jgi:chloramphenicol-sensitive protein RarD